MKSKAVVAGVGMTSFGKYLDRGLKSLGTQAVTAALADAGIDASQLEAAYVGNASAGVVTGQESIRGQVILRSMGLGRLPVVNVENACASSSTAFNQACAMVSAGYYDVVLALGVEKLSHQDKAVSFGAFTGAVDVEALATILDQLDQGSAGTGAPATTGADSTSGAGTSRSMFMDVYAQVARAHMEAFGTTVEQFAAVSAKNSYHASMNARAQFRETLTVEEVLAQPVIADPLTRSMCSPIGDGAAAAIVVSETMARQLGLTRPVRVVSSVLRSGWDHGPAEPGTGEVCSAEAYEEAGIGPEDLSVVECHDATAPSEIFAYEALSLCGRGEGGRLVEDGVTRLGGRCPVNPSGGLLRKGHPVGATGIAQIVELTEQLQGRSGDRQVEGAQVALAHNGGGTIGPDAAAMCVTILAL
jgi:acetyl-CoA acetyltransferase